MHRRIKKHTNKLYIPYLMKLGKKMSYKNLRYMSNMCRYYINNTWKDKLFWYIVTHRIRIWCKAKEVN